MIINHFLYCNLWFYKILVIFHCLPIKKIYELLTTFLFLTPFYFVFSLFYSINKWDNKKYKKLTKKKSKNMRVRKKQKGGKRLQNHRVKLVLHFLFCYIMPYYYRSSSFFLFFFLDKTCNRENYFSYFLTK